MWPTVQQAGWIARPPLTPCDLEVTVYTACVDLTRSRPGYSIQLNDTVNLYLHCASHHATQCGNQLTSWCACHRLGHRYRHWLQAPSCVCVCVCVSYAGQAGRGQPAGKVMPCADYFWLVEGHLCLAGCQKAGYCMPEYQDIRLKGASGLSSCLFCLSPFLNSPFHVMAPRSPKAKVETVQT